MKRMLAAAAGASLLLMLGGCGGDDDKVDEAGAGSDATGGTSVAGSPDAAKTDTPTGDEGTPEVVTPRAGMAHTHPVRFDSAEVVDQRTVRLTFYGGVEPCDVLDSVKVKYNPGDITMTLYSGSDPAKPDSVCIEIAKLKAVDVALTEDVGEREIKDGAKDASAASSGKTGNGATDAPAGKISADTPAVELTPKPGQADVHTISWDRYEMVDPSTVRIYFMAGVEPCTVLDHVSTVYAQEIIRIALFTGSDPAQPGAVCPMLARMAYTDVKLTEPVGSREIVDDTTTD
ncbi:MAG TPA: hypothetical protein VNC22_11520 [Sporichthya sp.]|jgi:hypothetical protein|nr:hypothetical protein [Sporichthya sp.]